MEKIRTGLLCLAGFMWVGVAFATAEPLNLKLAEQIALENNLQIKAQSYQTLASETLVRKGYGIYDPLLTGQYTEGSLSEQYNQQFFNSKVTTRSRLFEVGISQLLPTGATLSATWNDLFRDVSPAPVIDPSYNGGLKFSLVQPLLKGFGSLVTEQEILFAIQDRDASLQDFRQTAFDVLVQVRQSFFDVLRYRDNLSYRETSVQLAQKVLQENKARLNAGVLPPIEVLEAEVGLKRREKDLLDARQQYEDALDQLALVLNLGTLAEVCSGVLDVPELDVDEKAGFKSALQRRPDLLRQRRVVEKTGLQQRIAHNQVLPSLDVSASYGHASLEESFDDSVSELGSSSLNNWEVGLTLSYPIGNRAARQEYAKAQLEQRSQEATLAQQEDQVLKEIRAAIRQLHVSRETIDLARHAKKLAEEKLKILFKRKEVGLATTRDVLEGEDDLASARTGEISAIADYNIALTDYWRATGVLLEQENVRFTGPLDPDANRPLLQMGN